MPYKVYPKGFDPHIAAGLPTKDDVRAGCVWTEEDVIKHRLLEKCYTIQDEKPSDLRWYEEIDN